MASTNDIEPMDQDVDEDLLQVQVPDDLTTDPIDPVEEELDFEADDLEVTDFAPTHPRTAPGANRRSQENTAGENIDEGVNDDSKVDSPVETITISVVGAKSDENGKEDGEISETQSQSEASDIEAEDNDSQYFSRSSSLRSSRRRNDIQRERSPVARKYPNPYLEFDDAKIQSRALRFGLGHASATNNSQEAVPTRLSDDDLLNVYINCGLIVDDGGNITLEKVGAHHRLDSILIRGTNHMNTNEIFKYLYDLGQKPVAMEWVNDAMCVVIYSNQYDAATSILKTTKPILMDPLLSERKRSIVQTSETDNKEEGEEKTDNNMNEDFDYNSVDVVPQSWITVPMPPGYVWRFGAPCEKAKGILVRYATKHDKKQERAERFSEYYKNYGNPNKAGNGKETTRMEKPRRRKKLRSDYIGSQESDQKEEFPAPETQLKVLNPNDKNGWGQLSAMWDDEEAFQKSARDRFSSARQRSRETEPGTPAVSPLKRHDSLKKDSPSHKPTDARDILKTRQKRKRGTNSSDEEDVSDNDNVSDNGRYDVNNWKDSGSSRRKRNSKVDDDDGDNMQWRERLAGPRMRMHADDEEEERMKRRAFRRLGHKRGSGDGGGLQTNSRDFSRESSNNSSFRSKSRRPISERLGVKRSSPRSLGDNEDVNVRDENEDSFPKPSGFDLRQKLISMRRSGNEDEEVEDEEEGLHDLIFYD